MPGLEINLPVISDEVEDNFAGATERLLTIHFGIPDPPILDNPAIRDIFRWDLPWNFADVKGGIFGSRSTMWHPARTKSLSSAGVDGKDFNRRGDTEALQADDDDIWGT